MHYVSGHEVAQQLAAEVQQLAFSPSPAWEKWEGEGDLGETETCQMGGVVAWRSTCYIDCSPELLVHIITQRQIEWDMNCREMQILEEYDNGNQIVLLTVQIPILNKLARFCLFRYISGNNAKGELYVVYQSVEHEDIPEGMLVTCAPSGFFVYPIEGEPNKCKLIMVYQFHPDDASNPQMRKNMYTGSQRIIYALSRASERIANKAGLWESTAVSSRKELYNSFTDINATNGWTPRQFTGVSTYIKQNQENEAECTVCLRSSFTLPFPTHTITEHLFSAIKDVGGWDPFLTDSKSLEMISDNAFILHCEAYWFDGTAIDIQLFVCKNIITDNFCDLTYKVLPNAHGYTSTSYVIGPSPSGSGESTVQWLSLTNQPYPAVEENLKRLHARVITHINGVYNRITSTLLRGDDGRGDDELPVACPSSSPGSPPSPPERPYLKIIDEFSELLMASQKIMFPIEPAHIILPWKGKRKLSPSPGLMNVGHMVAKGKGNKPFLFLVPDAADGGMRRFVRRKRGSSLTHSNFLRLPHELLYEIFLFLDPIALCSIMQSCTQFRELVTHSNIWRTLFLRRWGHVRGRVARRYCGDDDPSTFFFSPTSPFSPSSWKDLFLEQKHIEEAWEAPEGRALSFSVAHAHTRDVSGMALLAARHRLVTGSKDRLVRVWDVMSGTCLVALKGNSSCVTVHPCGDAQVKLGYKDGVVRVLDVMSEECTSEMRLGELMKGYVFAPNRIFTWDHNFNAVQWDELTGQRVATYGGHTKTIQACCLDLPSSLLISGSKDTTVKLWDTRNGELVASVLGHTKSVNGMAKMGGNCFISVSNDHSVRVWDTRKTSTSLHILTGHEDKVRRVEYSEIAKKICTVGIDGACIWRSDDLTLARKEFFEPLTSLAMDEESIAFGGAHGGLKFYDFTPHK